MMMKRLLMVSGLIEIATGIGLLAVPALIVSILLGGALDTTAGLALAHLAGAAVLSLGLICWRGSRDARSSAAYEIVAGMLVYNLAAAVLFIYFRYGAGMTGIGLLPVSALHSALAVWCVVCLKTKG